MTPGIYTDVIPAEQNDAAPSNGAVVASEGQPKAPQGEPQGMGPLLDETDEKKVFLAIDQIVERQEALAKNREAARKHWARVRRGVQFSVLNKSEDQAVWTAQLPPGVTDTPSPIPNKADDLCRKIVAQIVVDIPQADPKAATDSEQDRSAADIAKRYLKQDGDESGTNDPELFIDVLDSAMTDASSFVHIWPDMQGGGWRPLRILAHPQALDATNPLVAQDPMTGEELPTADYVLRYVSDGNQFVDSPSEAARQWMPKLRRDVLGPQHVRTVPETTNVGSASAVILLMVGPVSELRKRVPDLEVDADLLASWQPRRAKSLIPQAMKARFKEQGKDKVQDDGSLVFWYQIYCKVGEYPEGADIVVSGANGGTVLRKATLRKDISREGDKETTVLLRDIPVSQFPALHDSEYRDPFGRRPLELFGATNEGLAQLYGAVLEDTDKRLRPNVFLPVTSPVQSWQMNQRTGEAIPVLSKDDLPMYEEFANLASFTPQVIELLEGSMREAAMLGSAAEMLNTPDAISGKAKTIELNQAKVALAPVAMNFLAFVKRYWRLKLQMAQVFLTIPQQVDIAGVDQAYKQRWWTGADFSGVKDVAIQAGTGTLMSPAEKQQFLGFAQSSGWVDPDEAMEVGRGTMADDLGLVSSPHEDSIKREIATWMQGPPDGWMEGFQAYQSEVQMLEQQQQPMDPNVPPAQPQAPQPWSPFLERPTNEDPSVATKQYRVLRDFIASTDYTKHDPAWRSAIDARYDQARRAAGVATMKEQADQQAMQDQQAADGKASEQDGKAAEKESDRQFNREENHLNRQAKGIKAA